MDVYEFDKCLLDRMEESTSVLLWNEKAIPASQVRNEWSYFIELQIEPAGWQALWKIPRVICEEFGVPYPTVVFGRVDQVLFKQLKAAFTIQAVQDDTVHLPETHEVALEDLYPTKSQENSALNVERTADCIDRLRFFYTQVWMPWDNDNDDDMNWVEKHLESRIRFCYDLRKRCIKKPLAAHIRSLIAEARYIQQRREYMELGLSDDEELDDTLNHTEITELMRMHLRLNIIRSEIEIFENPEMRQIYEDMNFDQEKYLKLSGGGDDGQKALLPQKINFIVASTCALGRQIELMKLAEKEIGRNAPVQMCPSLQNALSICSSSDTIFLTPGRHTIKFLEYLNDNGRISGLQDGSASEGSQDVVLASPDSDSILLVFDGNFTLDNLVMDCSNVRTGIVVKNGELTVRNCHLFGDEKSSTQEGLVCLPGAKVTLQNCVIEKFATALRVKGSGEVSLQKSKITHCPLSIDATPQSIVRFHDTTIAQAKRCGIMVESMKLKNEQIDHVILKSIAEVESATSVPPKWSGKCDFDGCARNIVIKNEKRVLVPREVLKTILDDNNETLVNHQDCDSSEE